MYGTAAFARISAQAMSTTPITFAFFDASSFGMVAASKWSPLTVTSKSIASSLSVNRTS